MAVRSSRFQKNEKPLTRFFDVWFFREFYDACNRFRKLVNQIFQPPGSRGFHMFRVMEILAHNFEICTIDYFLSNTIIRLLLDY